jgi:hypothetical protein
MIYRIYDANKYLNIKYNVKQYLFIALILCVYTIIYYLNNKVVSLIFLPVFIFIALWVNKSVLGEIIVFVKKKIGR